MQKKISNKPTNEPVKPDVKNQAADPTAGAVYTSKLDQVLYPKYGTAPSEIAAARKYTQGKERNHFKYFSKYGEMLEPTKEEIKRAKAPSMWEQIYDGLSPIEKGQHNAEQRKKGMNGKTAEPINKVNDYGPVKYDKNGYPSKATPTQVGEMAKKFEEMRQMTGEPDKPKPKKKINAYADVKITIPTINYSLLRKPEHEARDVALEKMRAYAFKPKDNSDADNGIGSFRKTIGRKLNASSSRSSWKKNNQTTYK